MEAIDPSIYKACDLKAMKKALDKYCFTRSLMPYAGEALFILMCFFCGLPAQAQIANSVFEKNRIQYGDMDWKYLAGDRFDIYFEEGGEHLAYFVKQNVPDQLEQVQMLLDYRIVNKFRIVIYNSYAEFDQTNLFPKWEDDNIGGYTDMEVLKGAVYFSGNHEEFKTQVKAVVARMVLNDWLYGGSIQDVFQNSTLINLPNWYVNGLVQYAAEGWPISKDMQLKEGILMGRFQDFNQLKPHEQDLIGQSLWNYISQQYGEQELAGILYYMRANKNMEAGFVFELGKRLAQLYSEWYLHNQWQYRKYPDIEMPKETAFPPKLNRMKVESVKAHPTEEMVAFTANNHGALEVWLMDFRKQQFERVFKSGYKLRSSYEPAVWPAMDWQPDGSALSITYLESGRPVMVNYNYSQKKLQKEKEALTELEQVLSVSYLPHGDRILMSALKNGQSDLFVYDLAFRELTQITDDVYDDLQPSVNSAGQVVFLSNRPDSIPAYTEKDSVVLGNFRIFEFNVLSEDFELEPVIGVQVETSKKLCWVSDSVIAYLTAESGIRNRNLLVMTPGPDSNSAAAIIDQSNYSSSIIDHDIQVSGQLIFDLWKSDAGYFISSLAVPALPLKSPVIRKKTLLAAEQPLVNEKPLKDERDSILLDSVQAGIDTVSLDHYFQTEFLWSREQLREYLQQKSTIEPDIAKSTKHEASDYSLTFSPLFLLTQVNNSVFYNRYITFLNKRNFLYDRPWDLLLELSLTDVPGDQRLSGGLRVSADFNELDLYVDYVYLKGRLDRTISFLRKTEKLAGRGIPTRETMQELRLTLDYPLNKIMSGQVAPFFRLDRTIPRSVNQTSIEAPIINRVLAGTRFQFVYNNAYARALNLYEGLRLRAWTDVFQGLNAGNGFLAVPGFEVRSYFTLPASITWASRYTMETSLGNQRVAFYLGGMDNWLYPRFNASNGTDVEEEYLFKVLAPTLRGFEQNIRNGSSYGVLNTELRFPVFKMLNKKPIRSEFTENFQVILFGDAGTAWTGHEILEGNFLVPLSPLNTPPVSATVNAIHQPIVQGVGFGARSILLGYFVKADLAWGIEDGKLQERVFYISLGLDF